jgi:glyoxylase-like metal-dependent hydrolase (beta-lactamase superfamily II)
MRVVVALGGNALLKRGGLYKSMVPDFPISHRRLYDGDRVTIGGRDWQVMVGYGHAPEHASLYCKALDVLISGDMLLPRISTNVAVRPIDPRSNPLRLFLESIRRYRDRRRDTRTALAVPFRGARASATGGAPRRAPELQAACASPRAAAGVPEILFGADAARFLPCATIAHLHYLHTTDSWRAMSAQTASRGLRRVEGGNRG